MSGDDVRSFTFFESGKAEPREPIARAPTPPASSSVPGIPEGAEHFGPYALLKLLGRGGQGSVYLAVDTKLKRKVALKVLNAGEGLSPAALLRFRREAEAAARLEHPGICAVYEAGEIDATPFIAMKYVEGEPLSRLIGEARAAGPPPRPEIPRRVALVEQAARALEAAHKSGVVHRDLKPQNLMITAQGSPVLLDFGLARDLESQGQTLTAAGDLLGTPLYMSPEQLRGQTKVDARTDVYSLGVTLYEYLTHERPFDAPTLDRLYQQILTKEPKDPRSVNPAIPEDLRVVVLTALAKEPERRYATAEAFADDLKAVLESRPIRARPASVAGRAWRWAKREPVKAALAAVLLLGAPALALLGGYLWASRGDIQFARFTKLQEELDARADEGLYCLSAGEYDRGKRLLQDVLAIDSSRGEAVGGLVIVAEDPAEAVRLAERHAALHPGDPDLMAVRALALDRAGRVEEASAIRKDVRYARSWFAHFADGFSRHFETYSGSRPAAEAALRDYTLALFKAKRPYYFTHYLRAVAAGVAGDDEAKRASVRVLLELWPERPHGWKLAAQAESDPTEKLRLIERALACADVTPHTGDSLRRERIVLLLAGDRKQEGEAALDELLRERAARAMPETEPDKSDLLQHTVGTAELCLSAGRRDHARALLTEVEREGSGGHKRLYARALYLGLAMMDLDDGDRGGAAEWGRKLVAALPESEVVHVDAAFLLLRAGRLDEALSECEAAFALVPENAYARAVRGCAFVARGDLEGARREWAEVERIAPWCLDDRCLQQSRWWGVVAALELRTLLFPDDAAAHDRLARYVLGPERRLGWHRRAALEAAQRAVDLTDGQNEAYLATLEEARRASGS